jgi:ribonuclease BN (tRNA processing enzyme)
VSTPVLTILGSGTLVPDADRHSAAHHLRVGSTSVLLDCGSGTVHGFARYGVRWQELTHVVISHFHADHIGDVAALMFAFKHGLTVPRTEPLTLVGPVGLRGLLDRLAAALGKHVLDPGFDLRVVELTPGDRHEAGNDVTLRCHPTPHTPESVAYRVEGSWGSVGYTGDTGPSEAVADFMAGCDLLVAECTVPEAMELDTHLSPESLAALARRALPGLLLVVHVGPRHTPDEAVQRIRRAYDGIVVPVTADGFRVRWTEDGPSVDRGAVPQ